MDLTHGVYRAILLLISAERRVFYCFRDCFAGTASSPVGVRVDWYELGESRLVYALNDWNRDHLRGLAWARRVGVRDLALEALQAYLRAELAAHEIAVRSVAPTARDHAAYARRRGIGHCLYVNAWHEVSLEATPGFEWSYMSANGLYRCQSWVYLAVEGRGVSIPMFEPVVAE